MTINHCSPEEIRENIYQIRQRVAEAADQCGRSADEIKVMAVTKTVPAELVNVAIDEGVTLLGENRVQEYLSKKDDYCEGPDIHFIGHLQSNKIKYIADDVTMIESVSSCDSAQKISDYMEKLNKTMDILLEVNIGSESSKNGFLPKELENKMEVLSNIPNIRVKGLMCIPPIGDSEKYFGRIQELFVDIKAKKLHNINMSILSMGMSGDFETAIRYGSGIIRLGTILFGKRVYQ